MMGEVSWLIPFTPKFFMRNKGINYSSLGSPAAFAKFDAPPKAWGINLDPPGPLPPVIDRSAGDWGLSALDLENITLGGLSGDLVMNWSAGDFVFAPPSENNAPKLIPGSSLASFLWGTNATKIVMNGSAADSKFLHDGSTDYTVVVVWQAAAHTQDQYIVSNTHSLTSQGFNIFVSTVGGKTVAKVSVGTTSTVLLSAQTPSSPPHPIYESPLTNTNILVFRFGKGGTYSARAGSVPFGSGTWTGTPSSSNPSQILCLGNRADLTNTNSALRGGVGLFSVSKKYLSDEEVMGIESWAQSNLGASIYEP